MKINKYENIFDLFRDSEEYPQNIAERGVEENYVYCYVSNTFLNGFINYVKVIKAVVVERYTCPPDCECINIHNGVTTKSDRCVVWDSPKFHERLKPMLAHHSNWSYAPDDVWILAETENFYWFFWYDRDCSDCAIGRASKELLKEDGIDREKVIGIFDSSSKNWYDYAKGKTFDFTEYCKNGWLRG